MLGGSWHGRSDKLQELSKVPLLFDVMHAWTVFSADS